MKIVRRSVGRAQILTDECLELAVARAGGRRAETLADFIVGLLARPLGTVIVAGALGALGALDEEVVVRALVANGIPLAIRRFRRALAARATGASYRSSRPGGVLLVLCVSEVDEGESKRALSRLKSAPLRMFFRCFLLPFIAVTVVCPH